MELPVVVVQSDAGPRPPAGTPVVIEVRDVTLQDAPSVTVASLETQVAAAGAHDDSSVLVTADIDVPDSARTRGSALNIWARVAASGEARTAVGDLITMQSIEVPRRAPADPLEVPVKRVR